MRFIQTTPSLTDSSSYARTEVGSTKGGDPSYEAGMAIGGPLVDDRIGFRLSAMYRRDGGYIDKVAGGFTTVDPRGALYGDSIDYHVTDVVRPDANWVSTTGARAALKFAITDNFTLTPSIFYQKVHANDGRGLFWLATSDPGSSHFATPTVRPGDPATNPALTELNASNRNEEDDSFMLPAVLAEWDLGSMQFVSNTSYFDRKANQTGDFTALYERLYSVAPSPRPGDYAPSQVDNWQHSFVQEMRLQSNDPDARLTWVAGLYYSRTQQHTIQEISSNFMFHTDSISVLGDPNLGYVDGTPFGPGSSAFENYFGVGLLPGSVTWGQDFEVIEKQQAAFAQADFRITDKFKVTLGIRGSKNELDLNASYYGAENNLNYALGRPCPDANCAPGEGAFAPVYPESKRGSSEKATTPKVGVSYELDDDNMIYATVAKGFRPAGAVLMVPNSQCGADLADVGYVDANGNSTQPPVYKSDSVWSYEIGSKNRLFGGRMTVDGSAYQIKWSNIQTSINLPICSYSFVDNVGDATSQGLDVAIRTQVWSGLTLGGTFAYNKTTFDDDVVTPNGQMLFGKDTGVPDVQAPVVYSLTSDYEFTLLDNQDMYAHVDYTHSVEQRRAGQTSPSSSQYQPLLPPVDAYGVLNMRLGMKLFQGDADLSLFVNNVTNESPYLLLVRGGTSAGYPSVWAGTTLRPRTYGLTLTYRY